MSRLLQAVLKAVDPAETDPELVRRFVADRDSAAFAALARRHGPLVWGVCRQMLPHDPDAEDAFQAVFLALARSAHTVRDPARLAGWLHGVAVRVCNRSRRTAARRRKREQAAAVSEQAPPAADADWDDLLSAVHEEVEQLPDAERTAFVLVCLEGVRQDDAAARLGWKPGTLTGRLCRARQKLLAQLTRRGVVPAAAAGAIGLSAANTPAGVPTAVLAKASDVLHAATIPGSVQFLAQGVTGMSGSFKKLAAALLVAGGLGATVAGGLLAQRPPDEPARGRERGRGAAPGDPAPTPPPAPAAPPAAPPAGGFGGVMGPVVRGWEYKKFGKPLSRFSEEELNQLGADGWELTATEHLVVNGGYHQATVFKRQKTTVGGRGMAGGGFNPLQVLGGPGGAAPVPGGGGVATGGLGGFSFGGTGTPNFDQMADRWLENEPKAKDGKVSKADASPRTQLLFDELDANKDGAADKAEYKAMMEKRFKATPPTAPAAPTPVAPPAAAEPPLVMMPLKNMRAVEMAQVINEVFTESSSSRTARSRVKVVAEPSTNTLIVRASADDLKAIQALVDRLDATAVPQPKR